MGKVNDRLILDLCYEEDSRAAVDMNIVLSESGDFIEIQGTGEETVFSRKELDGILELAESGIGEIILRQREVLREDCSGNL